MISVTEALRLIRETVPSRQIIEVDVARSRNLKLAEDITAKLSQPPAAVSAMDGYAVRLSDVVSPNARLAIIGESRAGEPFTGSIGSGQTVRVFTGAHIPSGADHVIIQENAERRGDQIICPQDYTKSAHIRPKGLDFSSGQILVRSDTLLTPYHISIAAAGNNPTLKVYTPHKVAVLTSGDELVAPGSSLRSGQIINSNSSAISGMIEEWGGIATDLGIAKDNLDSLVSTIQLADSDTDIFVAVGGASVGDYDYMRRAFAEAGFDFIFEKVAVKPGKPTWLAKRHKQVVLGLPGNPASALVCANLFLKPMVTREDHSPTLRAKLSEAVPKNGPRETYLRATRTVGDDGVVSVLPSRTQDSSLINPFLTSDCLIRRKPAAAAAPAGELVTVLPLR